MNKQATGIALIGAGMIAQRHVEAVSALGVDVQLKVVLSQHPDEAEHLSRYYRGDKPLFTSDLAAVTHNADIQIAIVATPPSVRIDIITALAKAGKHVLLEKPVARNTDEAIRVVEICENAGVLLGVVFQHRMRESSKAAAHLLATGMLGKQGLIDITVPLWRDQSYYDELQRGTYARDGGGVLITQAIHTIDLALSLTGSVTSVQAMTATTPLHKMESEDFALAGLQFNSGAVGSLVASTATYPHGRETITLHCENGSLYLSADSLDVYWRDGRHEISPSDNEKLDKKSSNAGKVRLHMAVIEDFVNAVHQGRKSLVSGRDALVAHRLIEAIENSARSRVAINLN